MTTATAQRVIREATLDDVDAVVAMSLRFISETPYGAAITGDPVRLLAFAERLIENQDGALFVADQAGELAGMIALWAFTHPYSGERIASELVWWVNPDQRGSLGVRLLKRAEQWAQAQGAAALQMIAPNERVEAFYVACGYDRVEASYQRRF